MRDAFSAAIKAIEEIADREHRKSNIIVCNLLEGENKEADKDSASVLLNYILEQQVNITKVFCLGCKTGKNRPLLIGLDCEQFPNVYILPDRTRAEQQQHKELVALLKQRKEKSECNIVICNGRIVTYHLRSHQASLIKPSQPQPVTVINPETSLIQLSPVQTTTSSNDVAANSS